MKERDLSGAVPCNVHTNCRVIFRREAWDEKRQILVRPTKGKVLALHFPDDDRNA